MFISITYGYTGYELCMYACMHMYVHGAMRAQGTDSFEGVIRPSSLRLRPPGRLNGLRYLRSN